MVNSPDDSAAPIDCSDKATVARLYDKMIRAAIAKTQSIVHRRDLATEIAHDSFLKLWQSNARFPNDKAVYVWIYKTCHRAAIDHLRSSAHRREHYGDDDLDNVTAPSAPRHGDKVMNRQLIQTYIGALKPQESEAFLYVALDGMTQVEVAEVMGLSRRTVQRLLERAEAIFEEIRRVDA